MKTNQNHNIQATSSAWAVQIMGIALTLGNLILYAMPILILSIAVGHWFPTNYLLEFIAIFAGQIIGILLVIRLERYRIRTAAQQAY
ncbi:hypothetical protein [Acidithiobacillus ferriphilus]|uniref:hypothetical protein n=1 Tax=Acidithiobacillus ferriphilus TaxID=1689834 RepID=UPI001C06A8F5|nr:hypothetical protein [Acidithiobacillus ferriphilus]MEB8534930.1 hypothetical protein [Acidithiobacillus ferriphilus]